MVFSQDLEKVENLVFRAFKKNKLQSFDSIFYFRKQIAT